MRVMWWVCEGCGGRGWGGGGGGGGGGGCVHAARKGFICVMGECEGVSV